METRDEWSNEYQIQTKQCHGEICCDFNKCGSNANQLIDEG